MINIGIIGASGYSGGELLRLLLRHPLAEIKFLSAGKYAGKEITSLYPNLLGEIEGCFEEYSKEKVLEECNVVFICLPHGLSQKIVPELLTDEHIIIDIGADFRLKDSALYNSWYGFKHKSEYLLDKAVYGLPEVYKEDIKQAKLVANPGCYPTSIILALAPLIENNLIENQPIVIDSKSGISGAGRKLEADYLFSQMTENMTCYKPGQHQHTPEIEQVLNDISEENHNISFVPHLVPMSRGIFTTVNASLAQAANLNDLKNIYAKYYQDAPFIHLLPEDKYPQTKNVAGTNNCHLQLAVDKKCQRVIVLSAIDNLIKGAAGQAIQNMNIILNLEEEKGLRYEAFHV